MHVVLPGNDALNVKFSDGNTRSNLSRHLMSLDLPGEDIHPSNMRPMHKHLALTQIKKGTQHS